MAADDAPSRQNVQAEVKKSQHTKFLLMCFFLALDIGMSSTLDYDDYADDNSNLLAGLFGVQIIVQITVFLILFLAAADTFLFQVGLLGILLREIALTLLLQVAYFALTIVVGAIRNSRYRSDRSHLEIIDYNPFFSLSVVQKVLSIPYYVANLQTTVRLEDPVYFNRDAWISLIQQMRKQH